MLKKIYIVLLILAILNIAIGFVLAGAGHGWITGFYFSFFPLVLMPLTGYAFSRSKRLISFLIIVLYACVSYILYFKTLEEGEGYFERIFEGITILTLLYFFLWFTPLIIIIYGFFKKVIKQQQNSNS